MYEILGLKNVLTEIILLAFVSYTYFSNSFLSGAQGEYAGLMTIKSYHENRGEGHRKVCEWLYLHP